MYFPVGSLGERLEDYAIDDFLAVNYGGRECFLALSLLYDDNHWGVIPHHVDHIFPRGLFTREHMDELGLDWSTRNRFWAQMNRIGNLELLGSHENQQKSDSDFGTWLATRDQSFRDRHLIPDDDNLLQFKNFDKFIEAREQLIRARLKTMFPSA